MPTFSLTHCGLSSRCLRRRIPFLSGFEPASWAAGLLDDAYSGSSDGQVKSRGWKEEGGTSTWQLAFPTLLGSKESEYSQCELGLPIHYAGILV